MSRDEVLSYACFDDRPYVESCKLLENNDEVDESRYVSCLSSTCCCWCSGKAGEEYCALQVSVNFFLITEILCEHGVIITRTSFLYLALWGRYVFFFLG